MLKYVLVNKNFQTWLVIGWQHKLPANQKQCYEIHVNVTLDVTSDLIWLFPYDPGPSALTMGL